MKICFFCFFLFFSCASLKKDQDQSIIRLQKKIAANDQDQRILKKKSEDMQIRLSQKKLDWIQRQMQDKKKYLSLLKEDSEKYKRFLNSELNSFFLMEREMLSEILTMPSFKDEGQKLFDEILVWITQLNEEKQAL